MKNSITIILIFGVFQNMFSQCYPNLHSTNWFDAWVSCESNVSPNPVNKNGHWLLFDLGQRYRVQRIKVWNFNDPSQLDLGVSKLKVEYSGNQINWYTNQVLDLERAPGHNRYEGMDWQDLQISEARYILLTAEANFGKSSCYGLGEVQFEVEKLIISNLEEENNAALKVIPQPNPFNQQVYLDIQLGSTSPASYQVLDLYGKIWKSGDLDNGNNHHIIRLITEDWPAGSYVFSIRQNKESQQTLLVKIK
ncbi:MAG: T9SS type A sorting domain-containing protein [Saprospiraceae bacterium]|nr:T9SS type A sorting domain-containing protein [Saprospiraceae bacterium]